MLLLLLLCKRGLPHTGKPQAHGNPDRIMANPAPRPKQASHRFDDNLGKQGQAGKFEHAGQSE